MLIEKIITLNDENIREIIAKWAGSSIDSVSLFTKEEWRGYGYDEHAENVIYAQINEKQEEALLL